MVLFNFIFLILIILIKIPFDIIRLFGISLEIRGKLKRKRKFLWQYIKASISGLDSSFIDYCFKNLRDQSQYVPLTKNPFIPGKNPIRPIAYYLPQFYQFPINDEWHGRGFTEWTNVTKTMPQFIGHWQPCLPHDVGFYTLKDTEIMHRQEELAKMYGIYGWCFYYYWFSGKRLMEKPLFNFLADQSIDMPFMLFWANETWTRKWQSSDPDKSMFDARVKQGDADLFVDDILPFWNDRRYIKTQDGRPMLYIYRILSDPNIAKFIGEMKDVCKARGLAEPYVMIFNNAQKDIPNPLDYRSDALGEFVWQYPHHFHSKNNKVNEIIFNKNANISVDSYDNLIDEGLYNYQCDYPLYKCAVTSYDNTSRHLYTNQGARVLQISPAKFQDWFRGIVKWTRENENAYNPQNYIFISAWNEWAEAMVLEPSHRFGYAYLDAVKTVLEEDQEKDRE